MSVEIVNEVVARFLAQSRNDVLAIKGAWGVGKTYAWHQLVTRQKDKIQPRIYSYVSLFGIASLADLRMAILTSSRPVEDIEVRATADSINRNWLTHVVAKANWVRQRFLNFEGGSILKDVFVTLDALTPSLVTDRLICFDDFERLNTDKISHDALLGFISTLKETANCKVAIILNDALVPEQKKSYQLYREKVIDIELQFDPTVDEAISWALKDDAPCVQQVKDCARMLEIKNVRILRKIASVVAAIEPAIKSKHPAVVRLTIPSVVLLTWCYYDRTGQAPDMAFVKNTNLLSTVRGRRKKDEDIKLTPEENRWTALLGVYKYGYYDELDAAICRVIEQGYLEGSGFEVQAAQRDADFRKGDLHQKFANAWSLFHDSFEDNEAELVSAITKSFEASAHQQNPSDLNAVVTLLRQLDEGKRADALIEVYIRARRHERDVFDLDSNPFGSQVNDAGVRDAFAKALGAMSSTITLRQAVESMAASNGWTPEEQSTLEAASVDDFYYLFKGKGSVPVHKMVAACRRFNQPPSQIAQRTDEALRRLGGESPLNRIRLRSYGISLEEPDADEAEAE